MKNKVKGNGWALLPLLVFVSFFLGSGIINNDFYALPAPVAVLLGIVTAFVLFKKKGISENVSNLVKGCGDFNILTMCIITLLAGAFAALAKQIGADQMVVLIATHYLSLKYLYAGFFILASFLSFASGTSVGTITALAPIVAGFVTIEGINMPLISAALLGGAMFGDNLSFISDTTIAATQSQGCQMKDKFRINIKIALPASLLTIIVLVFLGNTQVQGTALQSVEVIQWVKIFPYIGVIVLASAGVNVFVTLFSGIVFSSILAIFWDNISIMKVFQGVYNGFAGMNETFLVFLLMGGLSLMVQQEGGIHYLLEKMTRFMNSKIKAKLGIAFLVGIIDAAIANNTIAIIVSAPVAKQISDKFELNPSHTASILDITSCIVQGIVPYGAQVLLLLKLVNTDVSYLNMLSKTYYIWFLFIFTIIYFSYISFKNSKEIK